MGGGRENVGRIHTDAATFRRFPGRDDRGQEALPSNPTSSLTPTAPMPAAGRQISFSPGAVGQ
eukprot:1917783-Pyramimonas_sp.AAC.1